MMAIPLTADMVRDRLLRNLGREEVHLRAEKDRQEEARRDGNAAAVERSQEMILRKQENVEGYRRQLADLAAE